MSQGSDKTLELLGVFSGRAKVLKAGRPKSAISKTSVHGFVNIAVSGLQGDEQADLRLHGGVEKAIHYYPAEHYSYWNKLLKASLSDRHFAIGDFGENLSAYGLLEENVCIGDVFRIGDSEIQITQGRTPCWKLNEHTRVPDMAKLFVETGRTGWYLRVLSAGRVSAGDRIELLSRPNPRFSVRDVTWARLARNPKMLRTEKLSDLKHISSGWAASFSQIERTKVINDPSLNWITPASE
jgi:MOSC domain-containing protein YiiM